ncbi:methyltransferase family protein 2, putative [Entamoeba histolytica HM-3:IMSS]|uniref:Methyltransferase family protein 2, putative n=1 Tax=Entamoeba histolytica HM-3:IMSS TaxID=885315 RepID=M7WEU1_ENTHI|nr:methyltransferase family protein 2, putative [Entamoeba histolytica HM-3:IMSS]
MTVLPEKIFKRHEEKAQIYWDKFYLKRRGFVASSKERNWMCREFKEIVYDPRDDIDVFEIGCGVGNSMVPLLRVNPSLKFYACDIAPKAVDAVNADEYLKGYLTAFVQDITQPIPTSIMTDYSVDYILLVFVLSTISPSMFNQTLKNLDRVLRPGGVFFFRDYGEGDMKQDIFEKRGNKLSERFYLRQDGTRIYFFSEEETSNFCKMLGYESMEQKMVCNTNINHKKNLTMVRKYIQAKWRKPLN